ncbi:hypothetical protein hbim_06157 [Mycolicibacterium mageritense]|uniref:VWFA domain-containing protein n=1 Tax=Mycolicibacterium mageritense TaxID=53462 RepID=A0AAI8U151_MYCME|nr:hypothetical protein hbim_06157 [Mycolicibacterium mageritense]
MGWLGLGRHSIPDPDDSDDEARYEPDPDQGYDEPEPPSYRYESDYPRGRGDRDDRPDYPQPGYDQPGHRPSQYREPDYRQPEPGYRTSRYRDAYDEPAPDQPGYSGDEYDEYADDYDNEYDDTYGDEYADGYDDDRDAPTAKFSAAGGPPPSTPTGPQHTGEWDGGEWTGSHRAVAGGRRGVSVGVIVALVTVVVVVAAVILWRFFGDMLSSRSDAAAARCVDGELSVAVVADPTIASHIETLANKYNETASPVGDRCIKVQVKSAGSDQVVSGFANTWPEELGERPALWIPSSQIAEARLEATAGAKTVSDSRSLVTSPVLLAVRPPLKDALAQQSWSTLPKLQTDPNALAGLKLPGWGALKLALPTRGNGDASYLVGEAVASASAPNGAPATAGIGAVNTLLSGQPKLDDNELNTAIDAMVNASDPATAPVHAVATTEQQLFARAATMSDAKSDIAGWLPPGPTAVADYPTVLLAGDWLSQEQVTAASEFSRALRKPEQLEELAKAGFRAEGTTAPSSDVTDFGPLGAAVSVGDDATRVTLANTMTAPAKTPAVTIMLDQSMPTDEGGKSRLANVVAALNTRLQALPSGAEVGLWTFDGTEGRSAVSTGPLSDQVGGQPRSEVLSSTLEEQTASGGGAVSFTTLRLVYTEAMANFREGQGNSVLVITTGPHSDRSLDGPGLQDFIKGAFDPARPVAVNVIDFGGDTDQATWEGVAEASGGTYQHIANSTSPELTTAISTMLG